MRARQPFFLIALFKLIKGLLLVVGIGAVKLLHRDVAETVTHWIDILRVDPDNRLIHAFLSRMLQVSPNQLKALSAGKFVYAGLLLTEGNGSATPTGVGWIVHHHHNRRADSA